MAASGAEIVLGERMLMKSFLIVLVVSFAAAVLQAQTTTEMETSMSAHIDRQLRQLPPGQDLLGAPTLKPNEIRAGPVTFSGIFVQLTKADDPLQLVNPWAPAEYGSTED